MPPALAAATGRGLWQIKAAAAAAEAAEAEAIGAAGPGALVAVPPPAAAAAAKAAGAGTGSVAGPAVGEYGSTDWRECGEWGALDVQRLGLTLNPKP